MRPEYHGPISISNVSEYVSVETFAQRSLAQMDTRWPSATDSCGPTDDGKEHNTRTCEVDNPQ